jgi:uncharacterized protein YfdQ (DUF2303 family)
MITDQAIEVLLRTGREQQRVDENPAGDPFYITPAGTVCSLASVYPPRRIERTVTLLDAGSFIEYVNRFKAEDASLIFAGLSETAATFTAILDYHTPGNEGAGYPAYCRHLAKFTTKPTPEWTSWLAANRKPLTQVEFATWLEDNLSLFATLPDSDAPSGAELLELVQSLHGHQNARFSSTVRLNNGAYSASYDEDVEVKGTTTTRPGQIELPKEIAGGFALFEGGEPYAVRARLKTRISERRLLLHFETVALPQLVRENIMAVVKQVATQTELTPLLGQP